MITAITILLWSKIPATQELAYVFLLCGMIGFLMDVVLLNIFISLAWIAIQIAF